MGNVARIQMEITACLKCPYLGPRRMGGYIYPYCQKTDNEDIIQDIDSVPDWCPFVLEKAG